MVLDTQLLTDVIVINAVVRSQIQSILGGGFNSIILEKQHDVYALNNFTSTVIWFVPQHSCKPFGTTSDDSVDY